MNISTGSPMGLSPWQAMGGLLRRDLRLAFRRKSEWLGVVFFFVLVAALFPLAIGPEPATLRLIGPGVLWVAALLASMLSLGRLFDADHQDGSLEQMALSAAPLSWLVSAKLGAHWLMSGLPLVLLSPLLGLQFALDPDALAMLALTLLIGTPVLTLLGAIGAALTLGVRGSGMLQSLLLLPLYVPVLVFGTGAVDAQVRGLGAEAHVSVLLALLLAAAAFSPWACAAALRLALES
ncbi:heme exporter protein CcmB [Limnohabitans sp. 2KL-17]|uniref:heme exporter protein CcmB n=1 Tax=Limnohabitans sp. 2KL-17 TaxID=1100704 RepID=UPI000DD1C0DC|nr:heme exporter protein CcmB [Limnohabitans sp. 2KL-17]PUE53104.1 heme exporter protein CcmB [Limnohabitans sp. 2KL-17]